MFKFLKSLIFIVAITSAAAAHSFGIIDGYRVTGDNKRQHAAICNAVIAVNVLKRQRADRYIDTQEYIIRVRTILKGLQLRGIRVK